MFQPSRSHSSWERCDKNILMFENWRERKMKKLRDKYVAAAWFWYTGYIHPLSTCAPSFNLLGLTVPEKSVTKNFDTWIFEKEKIKNKGTHKQQLPGSGIHHTSTHCLHVYQISTFQASQFLIKVWQKILIFENWRERKMKKKGTNKQQQSDSGTHDTSAHYPCVYQVSIF